MHRLTNLFLAIAIPSASVACLPDDEGPDPSAVKGHKVEALEADLELGPPPDFAEEKPLLVPSERGGGVPSVLAHSTRPASMAADQAALDLIPDRSSWPIANYAHSTCIVARGGSNEAAVVKTTCSLAFIDQHWGFVSTGDGYYQVKNLNSGKCLLVRGGAPETAAVQYTCSPFIDQHWVVIEDVTGRFFMLQNRNSGQCLVMRASENNARQVPCNGQFIDQWWRRGMPGVPPRTDDLSKPVYFVHGYSDNGSGFNANGAYWDNFIADFRFDGSPSFTGPIARPWTYCYYSNDTNCDLLVPGSRNKSIKSVGADLAWEIYDHFSKFGVAVDAVGHSMGGLVIRAAVTGVQRGDPAFPPFLYVEDVTTLSTPHRGAPAAWACTFTQCIDMRGGSAFLSWLYDNPQGSGWGTDWTLVGFDDDLTVPAWSAVPDNMWTVGHKVIYDSGEVLPKLTAHMDLLEHVSGHYNYGYCDWFSGGCSMASRNTFYHVIAGIDPGRITRYGTSYSTW